MPDRLAAATKNVDAIQTAVFLTDSAQMGSLLGAFHVYRRFIKEFFEISRLLNYYLQKHKELRWLNPTTKALYV